MGRSNQNVRNKQQGVGFWKLTVTLCVLIFTAFGCASDGTSSDGYMAESDAGSTADGAAFTADSMHFRKEMPKRPESTRLDFYYKHCTEMNEASFYSKTSYDCSTPY